SGYSGIGKSIVVKQIQSPVIEKNGMYLTGKFDQFKRNIPYFAFIEVFDEAIRNILAASDERINYWKEKITGVLGTNASLITEVIPNLELIIGKYPPTHKLQPAEQEYRFRMVFLDFIFCFSDPGHPLVLFLDDLQWSDIPSLNLIERVLTIPGKSPVLIIGAYRNNEVDEFHPLSFMINQIKKENVYIEEISLQPLDQSTTIQIVADSFAIPLNDAKELGRHVYSKTKGNPFFINRFLLSLYEKRYIHPDEEGGWKWDQKVLESLDYTDNVIDLMAKELSDLPPDTQEMMKAASVIGNTFNLGTLAAIVKKPQHEVFDILSPVLKAGYILTADVNYRTLSLYQDGIEENFLEESDKIHSNFKFLHDRVQQAAYVLIPETRRAEMHLKTGRILFENTPNEKLGDVVFDIVSHFGEYVQFINDPEERKEVCRLFFIAGKKAKDSTSYDVAVKYLSSARLLLEDDCWTKNYELTYSIYSELGESEYLNSDHNQAEIIFEQILQYARTNLDKLRIYYLHSSLFHKIGNSVKALELGRKAMSLYGIKFPEKPLSIKLMASWQLLKFLFLFSTKFRNTDKLYNLKECTDPEIIDINKYLIDLSTSAYQINQELMIIVTFKIINFHIKYGFTDASSWGFSAFSTITYSALGLSKRGLSLWDLAIKLHRKTQSPAIKTKLGYTVNGFYAHWKYPIRDNFDANLSNINDCMANGDPSFVAFGITDFIWIKSVTGLPLNLVLNETRSHLDYLKRTKNEIGLSFTTPQIQVLKTLVGQTSKPGNWNDNEFDADQFLEKQHETGNMTAVARYYNAKLPLFYFFEEFEDGLQWAEKGDKYQANLLGFHAVSEWSFYYSLLIASAYDTMVNIDKRKYTKILKKNIGWFKHWVKGCPENYEQQWLILQGEEKAMAGKFGPAIRFFEQAIAASSKNGFTQYEAIANQQAARLMSAAGMNKQSLHYLKDARSLYHRWNATGVCNIMKMKYPDLFHSGVVRDEEFTLHEPTSANSNSSANALDFSTVVKASQSLASELRLDELLGRLIYIIIENAGAQRGVLILNKNNELIIAAEGNSGPNNARVLENETVTGSTIIPVSLINYSWRTQEKISVANAFQDEKYQSDPYIRNNKIMSVICFPITNKGNKIGLIYLENNLIEGVFNSGRIEVLNLLSGQIGISIENAMLYENLEVKVSERTQELATQKELAEMQRSEAIQQRKLADEERKKSDDLLLNILPLEIADELKSKGTSEARLFNNVTVLFTDFVNFTKISEHLSPNDLVFELNHCFEAFDNIIEANGLEKIKTIGDAYLAVCGLPKENRSHASVTVKTALEIIYWVKNPVNKCKFDIRIGINSGPVVAGIVGIKKYVYDIWGDTVNTAARMEATSEPGKINLSDTTFQLIEGKFSCTYRGKIEAKNKGTINMYFVDIPYE
ncbi:MAG: AAA family ATPase, partial [Saprospiraceae bacterium]|nr:AAA family ATPase [Saprospiraceae bacterium]